MRTPRPGIDRALLHLLEELVGELDLDRMCERLHRTLVLLLGCVQLSIGDTRPGSPIAVSRADADQLTFTLPSDGDRVLEVRVHGVGGDDRFERRLIERAHPLLVRLWAGAVEVQTLRRRLDSAPEDEMGPLLAAALARRGLTARQAEVLMTVAHGRSNRDAARALGLSERTVQKHLEHCYRTLGVTGRSQASNVVWSLASRRAADRRDAPPKPRSC
jgi:DNA-binding CsgD family transcriptional regulator